MFDKNRYVHEVLIYKISFVYIFHIFWWDVAQVFTVQFEWVELNICFNRTAWIPQITADQSEIPRRRAPESLRDRRSVLTDSGVAKNSQWMGSVPFPRAEQDFRQDHFSFKIWHLVATISMIFPRFNLTNSV